MVEEGRKNERKEGREGGKERLQNITVKKINSIKIFLLTHIIPVLFLPFFFFFFFFFFFPHLRLCRID